MRRPSPALIVAMAALFLALGGAGFAASLALSPVSSAKPLVLLPAKVSADGKVTGARITGGRVSAGVYTLTIQGTSFGVGRSAPVNSSVSPTITISGKGVTTIPPQCSVSGESMLSNGSAKVRVNCFAYGPAGWQPTDAAFDFQIVGPR